MEHVIVGQNSSNQRHIPTQAIVEIFIKRLAVLEKRFSMSLPLSHIEFLSMHRVQKDNSSELQSKLTAKAGLKIVAEKYLIISDYCTDWVE